ncbi:MAG: hypothetical protein PHY93_10180 [Bacteriovorax sp.]|nr:hypothetical protein [Bacteriovorax sp.]
MKRAKNKILISLFLLSITGQAFAMGSKIPQMANLRTTLSTLGKAPASTDSIPTTSNQLPALLSLLPILLNPTPLSIVSSLPTLINLIPTLINLLPSSTSQLPTLITKLPTSTSKLPTVITKATTSTRPITSVADPTRPEPPSAITPTNGGAYIDQIKTIAADSTCANYSWKNRGKAPVGYISGVALSYARSLCRLKTNSTLSQTMSAASSGNATKDAIAHYQSIFAALPISVTTAGQEPLRALYTLGMGLGMRESSGSYCEGWDKSAGSNRSSSAAEAGAFQTSYDSIASSPELSKLYAEYKASPENCLQDVFKQGASCGSTSILGSGAGAEYQAFNKSCPAFATEYAMTMLRIQRGHYGPINRKEAEVVPACNQMLKIVQDLINNDPYACQDII